MGGRLVFKVFDEDTVRHFARKLGQGIKYLHDRNIVHRDIKAENILFKQLESIQEPILTEFEHARMLAPGEMCTELCGTRGCMSPELLNMEPYALTNDIWAFGALLYMLTPQNWLYF